MAKISTHLIGIALPLYIALEFMSGRVWRLLRILMVFAVAVLWSIPLYQYDIDVDYIDLLDTAHAKFRSDIQSVVRAAWTSMTISCAVMFVVVILKRFDKFKGRLMNIIACCVVVLFLIASGMAVIDDYGGEIGQNPLTKYPEWTASFPVNSYWTLFTFASIVCYDLVSF